MTALPERFVARVLCESGDAEGRALCEALADTLPPTSIRLNPFKTGAEFAGEPVAWSRHGLYLAERPSFTADTAFHAGCYYVQEAGSQFVGHILESTGIGDGRILDMCAAPGGKTTLYSSLAGRSGLVVANEPVKNRAAVLADNVRKWGIGNTVVTCNYPSAFVNCKMFDVVAADAPCSGEGMFRKDERAREEWSESGVAMCAARQSEILDDAWQALKEGGVLLYSTCTFNRTENEGVLERFIERHDGELCEAEHIECPEEWGIVAGRVGVFQTFRFYPHKTRTEGFFVAVARKSGQAKSDRSDAGRGKPRRQVLAEAGGAVRKELERWFVNPAEMVFAMIGEDIYAYRREHFDEVRMLSERLNAIYSGVCAGRIFGGRLKPEHPLALCCDLNREAVSVAELGREDALKYLRKDVFDVSPLAEGMNLITCNGCALGFAKRIGGRCNNLYPNSLRIFNMNI